MALQEWRKELFSQKAKFEETIRQLKGALEEASMKIGCGFGQGFSGGNIREKDAGQNAAREGGTQ